MAEQSHITVTVVNRPTPAGVCRPSAEATVLVMPGCHAVAVRGGEITEDYDGGVILSQQYVGDGDEGSIESISLWGAWVPPGLPRGGSIDLQVVPYTIEAEPRLWDTAIPGSLILMPDVPADQLPVVEGHGGNDLGWYAICTASDPGPVKAIFLAGEWLPRCLQSK